MVFDPERINRQKEMFTMMLWTIEEPKASKGRKTSGTIAMGNPLDPVKTYVSQCKAQGMTYPQTLAAIEEQFQFFPTEAEIVLEDLWK